MIEIEALVSMAVYDTSQQSSIGLNTKRLNMLLAVLEKRVGFRLSVKDVFLNITGGITVDDPSIDLAVVAAIISSNQDIPIPKDVCFATEIGLSWEVRLFQRVEQRIQEAEKLGIDTIFMSMYNKINLKPKSVQDRLISKIEEIRDYLV